MRGLFFDLGSFDGVGIEQIQARQGEGHFLHRFSAA